MEDEEEITNVEEEVEKCVEVDGKRWLDGGYVAGNLAVITEEVVAISTKHVIKFVFLRSGKSRLYVPGGESDGVSVMTGKDDLSALAWSERCVHPRVFVHQYNNPLDLKTLKGEAMMEFKCLSFSHDRFLLGISGVPDFIVNLWDWQTETLLTSVHTELVGPTSANVKIISAAFPPDASGGGVAKMFATLWAGKICIWDIEKVSDSFNIVKKSLSVNSILSFTWCFPHDLFLLNNSGDIFKVDTSNIVANKMKVDPELTDQLKKMKMKNCEFHLKSHYDGMLLFAPGIVFILGITGKRDTISLVKSVDIDQTIINISEFSTCYKYIAWTHTGRLVTINTEEKTVSLETSLTNDPWVKYNAACFVPKFPRFFITIDKYQVIRVMDAQYKKELWKKQIRIEPISMIPYPSLPAFILGTMEGRLMFFSLDIPPQPVDFDEAQENVKSKINVKYVGDILLHRHPVDNMVIDAKTGLCVAVSNEEGLVVVVDAKNLSKVTYLDEVTVEGKVLDVHITHKTLIVLSTTPGCEEDYGDLITLIKVDQKKKSLSISNVFNLCSPCSGVALADNCKFFFSVMLTTKYLAKFPLSEEEQSSSVSPVSSAPSLHELAVHQIQFTDWGRLALLGRDGRVSLHSTDLATAPEIFDLQHYQSGGVIDGNIANNGNILTISEDGTLVMFQRKEPIDATTEVDKQILTQMQKMKAVEEDRDDGEKELSWSEKKNLELKENERKKFENEINTITETVESMAEQVARLLDDNDSLPEKDQLDRKLFELDVDEQSRQIAEGEDKVADLKMDLRAWTLARQQVSIKIKKDVWDKMEVAGRSLTGIKSGTSVCNFPLLVMNEEDHRRLSDTKAERRLEMSLVKETMEVKGGQASSTNSARSSLNPGTPTPRQSRSESPTSTTGLKTDHKTEDDESRYELLGSRSYLYIDIDSTLLIPQLEITTQKQSQQQLILLKDVVRQLKMFFNKKFDQLFQDKEEAFEKINSLNERMDSVLAELRKEEEILRPSWTADEKPEMDLPTDPQETSDVKVEGGTNSGRTSAGGGKDHHRKRAHLMTMESGSGKNTIPPPLFMKIKKPETFTDEEVAAAESYEAEVQRMTEKGHFRKRELEAEKNTLEVQIEEIMVSIDKKVMDLFWLRISIEKCVLSEELKMLSLNRDLGIRDKLGKEQELIRIKLQGAEEEFSKTRESLENGVQLLEDMKKTYKEKQDQDKHMDKNFKREFPGLGFHQVDSLYKLFKKRPKAAERLEKSADSWAQQKHDSRRESKAMIIYRMAKIKSAESP